MKDFKNLTVGEIVSQNIGYARTFQKYGIDFCCGGNISLIKAAENASALIEDVVKELECGVDLSVGVSPAINFNDWSLDLLIDYIYKYQHNYIRTAGPKITELMDKVVTAHANSDPHLHKVKELFRQSLIDLNNHLDKEEQILFPLIRDMLRAESLGARIGEFHCGTVQNPIRVMMEEHDNEGERFRTISKLTNSYTPPAHACGSYKLLLNELRQFEENLHLHIHAENNILFPKAVVLEEKVM